MEIISSLLIAILSYKIKLIDDRKFNNFEKFKDYLKREGKIEPKHEIYEQDVWLEKDIRINLMAEYEKSNQGEKYAILDYYKDYVDNERSRNILIAFIVLNAIYFVETEASHLTNLILNFMIILPSIIMPFLPPKNSIFNNAIISVDKSKIAEEKYLKIDKELQQELSSIRKKYKVKIK